MDLYNAAKLIPETITRENFKAKTGYILNGPHPLISDGFLLAYGSKFECLMFKLVDSSSLEARFGLQLKGGPHIVPITFEEATREDGEPLSGILMPKYDRSLQQDDGLYPYDSIFEGGLQIKEALHYMHVRRV